MRNLQVLEPEAHQPGNARPVSRAVPCGGAGIVPTPASNVPPSPAGKREGASSSGGVAGKAVKKSDMTPQQVADWIWSRCHDDCGCLIWDGAISKNSGPAVTSPYTGRTTPARRVLMQALGYDIAGKTCTTTCGHQACMEREHLVAWTRRELQLRTGKALSKNMLRSAKLAEAARRRSYLTMDLVREIRASGMRAKQAADHWSIPLQTAARVLRHDSWREYGSNPFAGLMR